MQTRDLLPYLSRSGYAARGVIYLIIGILALMPIISLSGSGGDTSSKGALQTLLSQPAGTALLALVAAGLVGFSAWRAVQAIANTDGHDDDMKGYVVRGALLVSAFTHLALAGYAISLLFQLGFGDEGSGGGGGKQAIAAWLLRQPFGPYLLGALGAAVAGAGLAQVWKGATVGYAKRLDVPEDQTWLTRPICSFGLVARGIAFCIVGGLFVFAAIHVDPSQAGGLPEALDWLKRQTFGFILLGVIAAGLLAFGLYSIIEAAYRRVGLEPSS